ncbi:MAG: branched-chain amino acid ABC transporter permease [Anaerolineae bacterium]|nr:branched-chain amino acid ABC transporter permease [Anaerolineae bacterium]
MTAIPSSLSPLAALRRLYRQPLIAGGVLLAYVALALLLLLNLDRRDVWFPQYTMLVFPLIVFAPFLVLESPLPTLAKGLSLALLLGVAVPLIGIYDSTYLELMIQISIFSALALGLNIVVGFAGLLDLGYIAFFAVGAYIWAVFTSVADTIFRTGFEFAPLTIGGNTLIAGFNVAPMAVAGTGLITVGSITLPLHAFYLFIFFGVLLAAVAGILLGLPVLRLRGDYLAIVTLGFGEIIRVLFNNLGEPGNITNGAQGLHGVMQPGSAFLIDPVNGIAGVMGVTLRTPAPVASQMLFYFLAIGIVGLIILLAQRLDNSPIGRAWTAIREDEVAAIAMGVPLVRMKLLAFATGAACAGAVGVLYAAKQTFVSPESFSLLQSINILAMVIVGGMGGIKGALLGASIVTLLNLHVLTNFALQINALRNIDYVIPAGSLFLTLALVTALVLYIIWRSTRSIYDAGQQLRSRLTGSVITLVLAGLLATRIVDFHIADWPSQLTPDKYQRFVFGILLVLMMLFRPEGLLPSARRKLELHREETVHEAEDIPDLDQRKTDDDFAAGR